MLVDQVRRQQAWPPASIQENCRHSPPEDTTTAWLRHQSLVISPKNVCAGFYSLPMSIELGAITIDCTDVAKVAKFWSAALERPIDEGASEFFATIDATVPGPARFFVQVPEGKTVKNRMHADYHSADRAAEVERLVGLGASILAEKDEWGTRWTVLADPEGNEFCVAQIPA